MLTADRIVLAPAAAARTVAAPEAVFMGHCAGRVDWRRLLAMPDALRRINALGFARQVEALHDMAAAGGPRTEDEADLARLLRLPLPMQTIAAFDALFPDARMQAVGYRTPLGGDRAWLPGAVADFFAVQSGARGEPLTLWVVPVDEAVGARAFLPDPSADLYAGDPWRGLGAFEIAMLPPNAGLVAFPDLERLSMPADLDPPPPLDLPRPSPGFLPCDLDLPPAANRAASPGVSAPDRADIVAALGDISRTVARLRPDMHVLLQMPFADMPGARGLPQPDAATVAALRTLADDGDGGAHRLQAIYPYLRTTDGHLSSATGMVAGRMAVTTARDGAWRSIAGRPLLFGSSAWPMLDSVTIADLREEGRLGVLATVDGAARLDDERVAARALATGSDRGSGGGSGEVSRFLGWLRRELTAFGTRLVFDADPRDPRPAVALEAFLGRLHGAGALGGRSTRDAFSLRQRADGDGRLIFEIALRLAPPIDRIHVTLGAHRLDLTRGVRGG